MDQPLRRPPFSLGLGRRRIFQEAQPLNFITHFVFALTFASIFTLVFTCTFTFVFASVFPFFFVFIIPIIFSSVFAAVFGFDFAMVPAFVAECYHAIVPRNALGLSILNTHHTQPPCDIHAPHLPGHLGPDELVDPLQRAQRTLELYPEPDTVSSDASPTPVPSYAPPTPISNETPHTLPDHSPASSPPRVRTPSPPGRQHAPPPPHSVPSLDVYDHYHPVGSHAMDTHPIVMSP